MRGDERPEWAGASSLAELMIAYEKAGGLVSGNYTVAQDSNDRMQVYEVD